MKKWSATVQFPTDSCFVARIVGATFGKSNSSDNPMVTIDWEVVSPSEYEIGGEMYNIAGVPTKTYHTSAVLPSNQNGLTQEEADAKTADCQKRFTDPTDGLWPKLGLDPATINWDNIDTRPLLGKLVLVQMSPDVEEQRKNPTAAQIEAAKKQGVRAQGDLMKHPITGAKLIKYWPKIREIFGLAPQQDGMQTPF